VQNKETAGGKEGTREPTIFQTGKKKGARKYFIHRRTDSTSTTIEKKTRTKSLKKEKNRDSSSNAFRRGIRLKRSRGSKTATPGAVYKRVGGGDKHACTNASVKSRVFKKRKKPTMTRTLNGNPKTRTAGGLVREATTGNEGRGTDVLKFHPDRI